MILNLTQHLATPEQIAQGVVDLPPVSVRESVEMVVEGAVKKTAVFRHVGFVRPE